MAGRQARRARGEARAFEVGEEVGVEVGSSSFRRRRARPRETRFEDIDWPQILALYDHLRALAPGPMVTVNRIVAVAMVHGPQAGLRELAEAEPALAGHRRVAAVRAHLLELAGERETARAEYERAARLTLSLPEQR
jgi:predicted RNA polymerase sigma factor